MSEVYTIIVYREDLYFKTLRVRGKDFKKIFKGNIWNCI